MRHLSHPVCHTGGATSTEPGRLGRPPPSYCALDGPPEDRPAQSSGMQRQRAPGWTGNSDRCKHRRHCPPLGPPPSRRRSVPRFHVHLKRVLSCLLPTKLRANETRGPYGIKYRATPQTLTLRPHHRGCLRTGIAAGGTCHTSGVLLSDPRPGPLPRGLPMLGCSS